MQTLTTPDLLSEIEAKGYLDTNSDLQADLHRRQHDDQVADELIKARNRLLAAFLPFVWYEDRNLDPVELMEQVANRLLLAAGVEKQRRFLLQVNRHDEHNGNASV